MQTLLEWGACEDAPVHFDRLVSNILLASKVLGGKTQLSHFVGLDRLCAWRWIHHEIPKVADLVRLSVAFNVPPRFWLCGTLHEADLRNRTPLPAIKSYPVLRVSRETVEAGLKAALLVDPPIPLSAIARSLGVSHESVLDWFPDLHAELVLRYKKFTHERRLVKELRRDELVREAMVHFRAIGKPFIVRQAFKYLGSRWTESQLHLNFVYRHIAARD